MKMKIIAAMICAAMLVLTACNTGGGAVASSEPPVSEAESKAESEAIPGLNAENYPRVDGSTANMPLMARVYSDICGVPLEEAQLMVNASGGTGAVWRNMMYDGADILFVYEAPEAIQKEIDEMGLKLEINPIGRDGMVFLVNAANPVDNLTRQQLIDIYTGKITDWSEVGGDAGPIAAFQRNEESGSQTLFLKLLMKDVTPMTPPTELVPAMMGALIEGVADYDGSGGAIGYSVFYYANLMYANPDLKLLSVDGVAPSDKSIEDGSYPLVNDFYVVIRAEEPDGSPARLLRDWMLSGAGKKALTESGYVAVS